MLRAKDFCSGGREEGAPSCLALAKEPFIPNEILCRASVHRTGKI